MFQIQQRMFIMFILGYCPFTGEWAVIEILYSIFFFENIWLRGQL
jgi:hypothetical protein